jgi:hypothetical protein
MPTASRFEAAGHRRLIQRRSMTTANIQGHEISIMLLERSTSDASHNRSRPAVHEKRTETIAKARISQDAGEQTVIMAYIHYWKGPDGTHILNPVISVGKTLPDDSVVFEIVKNGDVDRLRRLLAESQVTLRDGDTYVTPSLHVRYCSIPCNNLSLTISN